MSLVSEDPDLILLPTDSENVLGAESRATENSQNIQILFHIDGAVKSVGVYSVNSANMYLYEAIQLAGGPVAEADLSKVNLASEVKHGQKISIPYKPQRVGLSGVVPPIRDDGGSRELININQATLQELQTVKGVGPSMAQRIVDYRDENGSFSSLDQLKKVKGIGAKTFAKLEKLICI